jgi:DNA-binding CsgD family transcriptional regulator
MTAPTIGAFPLPQQPGRRPGPVTAGAADRPSPEHAAAVVEQLLHLAGQVRGWQHALLRTPDEVGALTGVLTADPYGVPPGPALRAVGTAQVRAAVAALAAGTGTVTWLCIRAAGQQPPVASPPANDPADDAADDPADNPADNPADDPVAGPLLARAEPVRVLVYAPDTGSARALADALIGSVRVTRTASAVLSGTRGDLVITAGADAIAIMTAPDGTLYADAVPGGAASALALLLMEALWEVALPPARAARIEEVAGDPVKREILGLLESGAKDEAIARALGVSLRTCRRHIAELLSATDAVSRFQAACRFARAGLLSPAR